MPKSRNLSWALLVLCLAVTVCVAAYPMYVIRPFRAQGARELAAALFVHQWGPKLAIVCALAAIFLVVRLWRGGRRLARTGSILLAGLTLLFTFLGRVNVYEIMFHRIDTPANEPASAANVDADDMVIAIKVDGHARAYPIRTMGYHHIANDWLGYTAVVATY
jgi:hypothetical protein